MHQSLHWASCPSHRLQPSPIKEQMYVKRCYRPASRLHTPWQNDYHLRLGFSRQSCAYLRSAILSISNTLTLCAVGIIQDSPIIISTPAPPTNIPARVIAPRTRVLFASPSALVKTAPSQIVLLVFSDVYFPFRRYPF